MVQYTKAGSIKVSGIFESLSGGECPLLMVDFSSVWNKIRDEK